MKELKEIIEENGIENVMFIADMKPLNTILGFGFTSSSDPDFAVPCKISEKRYKVSEGYKITLQPIYPQFASENYYQSDLQMMINQGMVKMFIQESSSRIPTVEYQKAMKFFKDNEKEIRESVEKYKGNYYKPEEPEITDPNEWYIQNWKWFVKFYKL